MKQLPVNVRFIPRWLNGVFSHLGASHQDFDRIVSKHDLESFRIANHQLLTRLKFLNITDFNFPDAVVPQGIKEDDIRFALFGPTLSDKKPAEWALTRFKIIPDNYDGLILIEDDTQPEQDLVAALTLALMQYRGKDVLGHASSFLQFLSRVKKYVSNPELVLDPQSFKRYVEKNTVKQLTDQPLRLGDPATSLNT